jgi:hypothetical protein
MFHLIKHLMEKQLLEKDKEHRWLECELENFDTNDLFYDFDRDVAVGDHHLFVLRVPKCTQCNFNFDVKCYRHLHCF